MGLQIAQISNAALQKLAWTYDKDNSQCLEEKEFNKFKQEAAKRKDISDEDFNQAMGLYISNPVSKNEVVLNLVGEVPPELEDNIKMLENCEEVITTQDSNGKTTYQVKFGDTWSSLAKKFGFTDKFPTLKEAVRALKEMAGVDYRAADMPKEIAIEE